MVELKSLQNTNTDNKALPQAVFGQGQKKRKSRSSVSEYKKSLQEKQTLKRLYCLSERQFGRYVKKTLSLKKVENMSDELIKTLESRLDSVIFRMGFAKSQAHARQLVSHAYFLVNGKPINIPSFSIKLGDIISFKESKKKKTLIKELTESLKKMQLPQWIQVDKEKMTGEVKSYPTMSQVNPPAEIPLIFEFYSK